MKLLKKEFSLCMHPTGYVMPLLSCLILVPGYPYGVCCFYMGLAIFFICLTARENHDAAYTLTLPVSRADAVRARIVFCVLLELAQILLMGLFILAKYAIGFMPNPAGLDAGLALIGEGESALSSLADCAIRVGERETYRVQELHLPVYHWLCAKLEDIFFTE